VPRSIARSLDISLIREESMCFARAVKNNVPADF
jgi:hypothetical protein